MGIKLKAGERGAGAEPEESVPEGVGGGAPPLVAVVMGSTSDWETMRHAAEVLKQFGVPHECAVVSAHRTPQWMAEFAEGAEGRGL
ncbi:MAG TPA: AIR carboxylase family protein, partial [Pyrinomonadaceae bacterium]